MFKVFDIRSDVAKFITDLYGVCRLSVSFAISLCWSFHNINKIKHRFVTFVILGSAFLLGFQFRDMFVVVIRYWLLRFEWIDWDILAVLGWGCLFMAS